MEIKKYKRLIIVFLFTIFSIFLFIKVDKTCYHHGLGSYINNIQLPNGLQPIYKTDFPPRLVIENKSVYNFFDTGGCDEISNVSSYFYNDSSMIVGRLNGSSLKYYIITKVSSYEFENKTNYELGWSEISTRYLYEIKHKYKYVYINIAGIELYQTTRFF